MTEEPLIYPVGMSRWEGEDAAVLAERWGVPGVHLFSEVGSTNDIARELAAGGAPSATVAVAERQLRGRGRVGRSWASPSGVGLWFSMVARPSPEALRSLPVRVGLAISEALDPFVVPRRALVKWPNDLLLGGKKLGGILCEGAWAGGDRLEHAVVGVGMNLLHEDEDYPPEIRGSATSLRQWMNGPVGRLAVADVVIPAVAAVVLEDWALPGIEAAVADARDALLGVHVEVVEPATGRILAAGEAAGIDADGSLKILSHGGMTNVHSGTIRPIEHF